MFPAPLVYVCTGVGVACLGNLFLISREYKDKAKKFSKEETERLLLSKSTSDFIKKIREKSLTLEMISDFYKQFAKANEPVSRFRKTWNGLLLSGILFIISAIVGCIEFGGWEVLVFLYTLSLAITFLVVALYCLYHLDKTL